MFTHKHPLRQRASFFVTPMSMEGIWLEEKLTYSGGAPASLAWPAAARANFATIVVPDVCRVYRWFWLNGATVGTDNLQMGLYYDDPAGQGPGKIFAAGNMALSAGTVNLCQFVDPTGPAPAGVTLGTSSTDAATYATASVRMYAGRMYTIAVENSHGTSASAVSGVTATGGGAPTFTSRATTQYNGTLNRVSLWTCVPTVDYTGTLTIAFGGVTQTGACWNLTEWHFVDTATNDGIVQAVTGTGTSVTPLATLAAFGSTNNATLGAFGWAAATTLTPGTGFFELADTSAATPAQALGVEYRPDNDTTVDGTITSAAWGSIGAEIKAASAPTDGFTLPPGRYWIGMWGSGTTATIFSHGGSAATSRYGNSYLQSSLGSTGTFGAGLPNFPTPASNSTNRVNVAGFTTIASP